MRRFLPLATLILAFPAALAQQSIARPRITQPISGRVLATVRNSVPAIALSRFEIGAAPANAELSHVRLMLARSAQQKAALKAYLAGEMNPASPHYHKWLTPEEFGDRFGLDQTDVDTLVSWLQSRGFTVYPVPSGRTDITFSGSVANIEATFNVHMRSFKRGVTSFVSNIDAPQIPAALAPVVRSIAGLDTLQPRPLYVKGGIGKYNPVKHELRSEYAVGSGQIALTAADAATIYNVPDVFNANYKSSDGPAYTGKGVTIGIIGDASIDMAPIQNYRSLFLGDATLPVVENPNDITTATNSGDSIEAYLDLEVAGGMAPGATLIYYEDSTAWGAIEDAINDDKADILSVSYGYDEWEDPSDDAEAIEEQAAAEGITVVVSAGDVGAASSGSGGDDSHGFAVNDMASTDYDVAVGGTEFSALESDANEYISSTNGSYYRSALGYIPEAVWNDATDNIGNLANDANPIVQPPKDGYAGSGGVSILNAKPSWQVGPGVPSDKMRDLPDVSMLADAGTFGADWLICTDNPPQGTSTNCTPNTQNQFGFELVGGTSAAAPAFAGILALVEEETGSRLGVADVNLYALYNSPKAGEVFHDITMGNNSEPCVAGSPSCAEDAAGAYYLTGYNAGLGYDLASGLGSVNATNLIKDWAASIKPSLLSAAISSSVTSAQPSDDDDPITLKVAVAAPAKSDPVPTGTVTLSAGDFSSDAATLDSTGAASITIPANTFQAGTVTLTIAYSGDGNYSSASQSTPITVVSEPGVVLAATTPAAVTAGGQATSFFQATSQNGYAGTLTFTCVLTSSPANAVDAPTCSIGAASLGVSTMVSEGTSATFYTTAPQSAANQPLSGPWEQTGMGGAALAGVLLFWIPGRKRAWRNLMCVLVAVCAVGLMTACSNADNSPLPNKPTPAPTPITIPGTTPGTYTFTIAATGNPTLKVVPTTTVAVTVN